MPRTRTLALALAAVAATAAALAGTGTAAADPGVVNARLINPGTKVFARPTEGIGCTLRVSCTGASAGGPGNLVVATTADASTPVQADCTLGAQTFVGLAEGRRGWAASSAVRLAPPGAAPGARLSDLGTCNPAYLAINT